MISIKKPVFSVRDVFKACISSVKSEKLKSALTKCKKKLMAEELDFDIKGRAALFYRIKRSTVIFGGIGKKAMTTVYDYRMRQTPAGYIYYNKLKIAAPFGKCPICSIRGADSLDHYLPKAEYPALAITPLNLIPSCIQCNKMKKVNYPTNSEEQTLHPYYDSVELDSWIGARVLRTVPISFEYFCLTPTNWDDVKKLRAVNHFESFKLNELFSSHANEELRGALTQLINLYNNDILQLQMHLEDAYSSRLMLGVNSWQAVMYNALRSDEWFYEGGLVVSEIL